MVKRAAVSVHPFKHEKQLRSVNWEKSATPFSSPGVTTDVQ